jgi:hypothetical protein
MFYTINCGLILSTEIAENKYFEKYILGWSAQSGARLGLVGRGLNQADDLGEEIGQADVCFEVGLNLFEG